MGRPGSLWSVLSGFLLVLGADAARADEVADPLRLVPANAEALVKIEQPRRIVDTVLNLDAVKELLKIDAVREAADTTNARRFNQLVAYFEKKLDLARFDLLDQLTGGGVVFAARYSTDKPSLLLVVQGKAEGTLQRFFQLALQIAEQEMARLELKVKFQKSKHGEIDILSLEKDFHLALAGSAVVVSNDAGYLKTALDLRQSGGKGSVAHKPGVQEARKALPADALVWGWAGLQSYRDLPPVKAGLEAVKLDPVQNFFYGGALDVFLRSPWAAFAVSQEGNSFVTSFRLPRGREGMSAKAALYMPADDAGSLALLEPKNVVFSLSYHLDLGKFWNDRAKILPAKELKELEEFDKKSALFLGGNKLSKLLQQVGPHHRVVVASRRETPLPDFAFVIDMRDEAIGKSLETIIRGAALILSFQANLKMTEEKIGDVTLVTYRLPEEMQKKVKLKLGNQALRYLVSPSFARVGDQFLVSSTAELGRDLIGLVKQSAPASPATLRMRVYSSGGAVALRAVEGQLLTQTILTQALPVDAAKEQVETFLRWLERLGALHFETAYGANNFTYDIRLILGTESAPRVPERIDE
jgi:hypothetical protein